MEDLGHFLDGIDMPAAGGGHVVGGARLAPTVDKLPGAAAETGTHVGVPKGEDGPSSLTPSAATNLKWPSLSWVSAR